MNVGQNGHVGKHAATSQDPEALAEVPDVRPLEFLIITYLGYICLTNRSFVLLLGSSVENAHTNGTSYGEAAEEEANHQSHSKPGLGIDCRDDSSVDNRAKSADGEVETHGECELFSFEPG